jgi:hypothetical protein
VLRVSISAGVSPADVREVVGDEHLADVEISVDGDRAPGITRVRSEADLEHARVTFREALATLRAARPNSELIYLFVAAPVSGCFAIGQELKPRNSPPIQTFRYRSHAGQASQQFALLLSIPDYQRCTLLSRTGRPSTRMARPVSMNRPGFSGGPIR